MRQYVEDFRMAEIRPFQAVRYNNRYAEDLDRLITPPYDVISPEEQNAFYQAHPLNMIRLVLGKQFPGDSESDNRYTRAAAALKQWLHDGTLVRQDKPSMILYRMEFQEPGGGDCQLDGLLALVKVDDYGKGKVLPHEKTYKGPKVDQLNLMRHCRANITPIHGLFDDDNDVVMNLYERFTENPPEQMATDANGTVHMSWSIDDPETVSPIMGFLADKSIFIADGHHRYETARAYRNELLESGVSDGAGDYIMMYLTSMTHPGLTILPAHRMVKGLSNLDIPTLLWNLAPYFETEALSFTDGDRHEVSRRLVERIRSYSHVGGKFGMVVQGEEAFQLLRLKAFRKIELLMDPEIPSTLRRLDVTILREIIMGLGLGLGKDNAEGQIEYTPLVSEALSKVLKGEVQISFILNPTRVDQMRAAAELGHKLPHKSTYFFPKVASGLAMHVF